MDLLSEVNEIGRGVEPGRGVIHPTFYFASWVPGGLENLIGEGLPDDPLGDGDLDQTQLCRR